MTELVRNKFQCLFEIRILHHYWLDEGSTVFDRITSQTKKDQLLRAYDMRSILAIAPTGACLKKLKGTGCAYQNTSLGCVVAAPKDAVFDGSDNFEFIVTAKDPAFFNYTAMTLQPRRITALYYEPERTTYRYKENVPLLSNLTGAFRMNNAEKTLFLSSEIPDLAADDRVEYLVISGSALKELTSDQPDATSRVLAVDAARMPVFIHQGDIPVIVPPAGLAGASERGIRLTKDTPDGVIMLVQLRARRPDDEDFSFIGSDGKAKDNAHPVFHIRYRNRTTSWRYFSRTTGLPVPDRTTDPDPLPLTYYGNADKNENQKPSEGVIMVEKSNGRIIRLISRVYI